MGAKKKIFEISKTQNKCMQSISVVGGGLSGLLFSYWLKKNNSTDTKIKIYEKNNEIKLACAEGLTNLRVQIKRLKREKLLNQNIRNEINRAIFSVDGEEYRFNFKNEFYIIDRKKLQQNLKSWLEKRVRFQQKKVRDFSEINNGFLVDATGSKENYKTALFSVNEIDGIKKQKTAYFDFRKDLDGYRWFFPHNKEKANIGVVRDGAQKNDLERWEKELKKKGISFKTQIEIGAGSLDCDYIKSNRRLLDKNKRLAKIGDTAGLMDPLFGEGINGAISSAYTLARSISNKKIERYPRIIKKENYRHLKRLNKLSKIQKNNFNKFKNIIRSLNNTNGFKITRPSQLIRNYPIKTLKLLKNMYIT
ncbi:hypothetical protein C9439_08090 [archaeon SCG-AAA382B04]|nr:hypothetical protein C9439_08090 [archaeon SCG-AAA382B04]